MCYGRLCITKPEVHDVDVVRMKGVYKTTHGWCCRQCHTTRRSDFVTYWSRPLQRHLTYCRACIQLGRMDDTHDIWQVASLSKVTEAAYTLPFDLSEQQQFASTHIVEAVKRQHRLLLHAVTGAGKTEMMYEAIQYARQQGKNVAIVSPRVDVVIELGLRITSIFKTEAIDVLYAGQVATTDGHFIIATVHQLYRYKGHFDVLFIDEVDAFPFKGCDGLHRAVVHALKAQHSCIIMTATPDRTLYQRFKIDQTIHLPARFHRHALPEPKMIYMKLRPQRIQYTFNKWLNEQCARDRFTLVFFNHIEVMQQAAKTYRLHFPDLIDVYSEDALRFEKVDALRAGKHRIVFTTTILERGFTMARLDVAVMHAHQFESAALIQMAGRSGRKAEAPTGTVHFYHTGKTLGMMRACRDIRKMNRLAREKGWIA